MGSRVRLVAVLVGHDEARVLGDEVLGQRDRTVRAERSGRVDDLGAEQRRHLAALVGDVVGHDEGDPVAPPASDHGEGDAGVARRRLEDDRVRAEQPARLEVLDEVLGDPILDRACRVHELELGEDPDGRVRRHPWDFDERRVADRAEDVFVAPAVWGEILVGVRVNVIGVDRLRRSRPDATQLPRPEGTHGQPPAIAGSSRTSSRSPTGVASPSR